MREQVNTKDKKCKKTLPDYRYQLAVLIGNQAIQKVGSDTEDEPQPEERASSSSKPSIPTHAPKPKAIEAPPVVSRPERAVLTDTDIETMLRTEAVTARRFGTPAISVVFNRRNGRIYHAENGIGVPSRFTPQIAPRIQDIDRLAKADQYSQTVGHGHHAEVIAANSAFESDDECGFEDLVVCTVRDKVKPGSKAKSGDDFPTCPDCEYILSGAKLITGDATKANAPSYLKATKKKPRRLPLPHKYVPVPAPRLLTSPMPVVIKSPEDTSAEIKPSVSTEKAEQESDDLDDLETAAPN